jgi:hypothetical protein
MSDDGKKKTPNWSWMFVVAALTLLATIAGVWIAWRSQVTSSSPGTVITTIVQNILGSATTLPATPPPSPTEPHSVIDPPSAMKTAQSDGLSASLMNIIVGENQITPELVVRNNTRSRVYVTDALFDGATGISVGNRSLIA